ncbi:uracil phosphoribosyltransferase [Oceanicaulis alexandrii]|uniref:uracil phosphoribosyltransferase n=1 Tax=Oceanicaulis alexandrii TaxID=153233 RepID=UPI0003B6479B|nr:uracil phosphoribosyltransferase [Oceanicaulis alexandrii]
MAVKELRSNVFVCDSVLIQHYLTLMKDARCPNAQFRQLTTEITRLLIYEALDTITIPAHFVSATDTRGTDYEGLFLDTSDFVLIGVVRSGMPMAAAAHSILPDAELGTVGYNATHVENPIFFEASPKLIGKFAFIFDPALATGQTALNVARLLKGSYDGNYNQMAVITLSAQEEALELLAQEAPDLPIITATTRKETYEGGKPSAGLGDFQSRLYGNRYREGYIL